MDTITELKPLFMRFFQEVDALNAKIKGQEEEIKKLRAENEVYARVIRSEAVEILNTTVEDEEEDEEDEQPQQQTSQPRDSHPLDTKHVEIKRGRKKKYTTAEERKEKRKEYNRNYRQKQKAKNTA